MKNKIGEFFKLIEESKIEIYNEFSLQHELGIFLREQYTDKKIQFERNISYFGFDKSNFKKKEIDIVMYTNEDNLDCVMELKFPRNGQVPESMFSFCKDIAFLEQLVVSGFKSAYFIAVADDKLFYSGNNDGIYGLFRGEQEITGTIQKPTGNKEETVHISGTYKAHWKDVKDNTKYCLIEVSKLL